MIQRQFYANVVILATLGVMPIFGETDSNAANIYFLEKQKFLFEIVHNLQEPLQNDEWIKMGKTLVLDTTHYLDFNNLMEKYLMKLNSGLLLPSNKIFDLSDKQHLEELQGLYYFLYNAQDFETLRRNICWARSHVQAQMFFFALTQTLIKREDLRDLSLPKIYEIWPQHFFADKYVKKLEHFDYVQWSKAEEFFRNQNITNKAICKVGQWWCKEGLPFKIYKEKVRKLFPEIIYGGQRNSSKWFQSLEDVAFYWLPVDFSREVADKKELTDRSLSYLIEDKSWNAYWYYINMGLWLNERGQYDLYGKVLRDWWFWNLQQMVVRYKMEVKSTSAFFKTNLDPHLINYQGLKFKATNDKALRRIWSFVNDLFATTQNALNEQTYELQNKTVLQLNNPHQLEYFLNEHFAIDKVLKAFMSIKNSHSKPTVFQYFETMLRSPEFYYFAEIILNLYKSLKTNFERYKPQDLQSVGVTINDVEITELRTYFEMHDTDVTNLLRSSNTYFEDQILWHESLIARQKSLQHQPFKLVFNLTSDQPQSILVRTFLARDWPTARNGLFQLDTFVSTLAAGYNIIERESNDFYGYMIPSLTYTELYHFTQLALNEEYQFPLNITLGNCRFPHHLKLPKGVAGSGLGVKFVFLITAYNYRFHKALNLECDFSSGILAFDDFPPGFPFDREMSDSIFLQDNVLIKKMNIYHDDNV